MREWVNELAEVHLEVDHNMVCAMGHANVGVLSVAGAGVPGVSMGVGWLGEHEEGTSKEKGKGKERAEVEDEGAGEGVGVAQMAGLREEGTGKAMAVVRMVVMMMPLMWSI